MQLVRRVVPFAIGAAVLAAMSVPAAASPPVPLISKLSDLARAQVTSGGPTTAPPESDTAAAVYSLGAGAGTGWRTAPGGGVLAVTKGKLTLRTAQGCGSRDLAAGQAAVLPAGRFQLASGGEAVEFAGVFLGLAKGAPDPLAGKSSAGRAAVAPAGCRGGAAGAASAAEQARATMVPISEYGVSVPEKGQANRIVAEDGKDLLVASYEFQPKFSTGWVKHAPMLAIVTHGTLTYYEGQAGQCVIAGEYGEGQAYTHPGTLHLATNEGPEVVRMTVVYFNLPHGGAGAAVPFLGNTIDAIDFSPLPPRDCPSVS